MPVDYFVLLRLRFKRIAGFLVARFNLIRMCEEMILLIDISHRPRHAFAVYRQRYPDPHCFTHSIEHGEMLCWRVMCLRTSREGIERRSVSREIRSGARPEALGAEVWPKDFPTEKYFWLLRARKTASKGREILCATAQRIFLTDPLLRHMTNERSETKRSPIETRAQFILDRLGFSWQDLRGKTVIDLGAHTAELARAARQHRIKVYSIDRNAPAFSLPKTTRERYVVAQAQDLPFPDEAVDIVLSHAGAIDIHPGNPESIRVLDEAVRVAKQEVRFDTFFMKESESEQDQIAYQFVKTKYPHAELHVSTIQMNRPELKGLRSAYIRVPKDS